MGRRRRDGAFAGLEDDFYEDTDSFAELVAEVEPPADGWRGRVAAVLGTSYGISAVVHLAILAALAAIIIATPAARDEVVITAKPKKPEPPVDETLPPDVKNEPKIPEEEQVEVPIILEPDEVTPEEEPKGTSLDNRTTKELESTSISDAFGLSGAPAGAYGHRGNKGKYFANGGTDGGWDAKERALRWLALHQSPDGRWSHGAWAAHCPETPACQDPPHGGRVYATAINVLTLEIYSRYERARDGERVASRTRPR